MVNELSLADGDMLRSVDAARASLTMLDQSVGDLDEFLKNLNQVRSASTATSARGLQTLAPQMQSASTSSTTRPSPRRKRRSSTTSPARGSSRRASRCSAWHVAGTLRDAAIRAAAAVRLDRHRLSHDAARRPYAGRRYRGHHSRRRHQEHARSVIAEAKSSVRRSSTSPTRTACTRGRSKSS